MTVDQIERLKTQWIDQRVEVRGGRETLTRFRDLVGVVRAVNFSGRCLVEFENGQDVGWYDIEPSELRALVPSSASDEIAATD